MVGVICPTPIHYLKGLFPVPKTKSTEILPTRSVYSELSTQTDSKPWGPTRLQ